MTGDGVNSYVWDRANRLLSMGGVSYQYNGDGNRIQQDALRYILDLQPGLAQVIGDSAGNRYIHSRRGVHAVNDGSMWQYPLTDALGSVRGYTDAHSNVLSNVNYSPIGVPDMNVIGPAFTGEWRSENETQYHRARHLAPGLGVWLSLDPFEGVMKRPMSLNGYSWVEGNTPNDAVGELIFHNRYNYGGGNPVNRVDRNGMCWTNASASSEQQTQCADAWYEYADIVTDTFTQSWPRDVHILMIQEARYWSALSYTEFVNQWNSSRPPSQVGPGTDLQATGGVMVLQGVAVSQLEPVIPGPGDAVGIPWALIGVCVAAIGAIANATGTIALPLRQPYYFTHSNDDANSRDDAIPVPIPQDRLDNEEIYYHYTDVAGYTAITSRIPMAIRANERNQVFVTQIQYGPYDAWMALFIGVPRYEHKGEYFLEFTINEGVTLHPGTQPNEMIHYGTMRQGREIALVLRHGPNPFEDQWR